MVRAYSAVLAFGLLSGVAFASGDTDNTLYSLQHGLEQLQANDCAGAVTTLQGATASSGFSQLTAEQQYIAQHLLALCAYDTQDYVTAGIMSRAASKTSFGDESDWYVRILVALRTNDHVDASVALERLATDWPATLNDLRLNAIYRALDDVDGTSEGDARNRTILKALFAAHWRSVHDPVYYSDGLWRRLAALSLEAGDGAMAREALSGITSPEVIIEVRSHKAYDAIVAAMPGRFDILKANRDLVDTLKSEIAKDPSKLELVVQLANTLTRLERPEEALALIDDALLKVKTGRQYRDTDNELNWVYDERSKALQVLGRGDEALTAMEAGSHFGEGGGNVSQVINLADVYCSLGRPQEALRALAPFNPKSASPFGAMAAEEARVCAYVQLGDTAGLDTALAFARSHSAAAPALALKMLLRAGHDDEALALALKYLGDKTKRDAILNALHVAKAPSGVRAQSFERQMRVRMAAFGKRPEIIAAVATFGHILDLPTIE